MEDLTRKQQGRRWRKTTQALACVMAFMTTYSLILPAITAEREDLSGPGEPAHVEERAQESADAPKVGDIVEIKETRAETDDSKENGTEEPHFLAALKDKVEETVSLGSSEEESETSGEALERDEADVDTHLGIVVETGVDASDESVVLVAEMTEDSSVQLTPMSVEEETVTLVDAEVAEEHPDLEEEVQEILDTVAEEEVLAPEAVEELIAQVDETMEDITSDGGGTFCG